LFFRFLNYILFTFSSSFSSSSSSLLFFPLSTASDIINSLRYYSEGQVGTNNKRQHVYLCFALLGLFFFGSGLLVPVAFVLVVYLFLFCFCRFCCSCLLAPVVMYFWSMVGNLRFRQVVVMEIPVLCL
jgi:hypothetical protein